MFTACAAGLSLDWLSTGTTMAVCYSVCNTTLYAAGCNYSVHPNSPYCLYSTPDHTVPLCPMPLSSLFSTPYSPLLIHHIILLSFTAWMAIVAPLTYLALLALPLSYLVPPLYLAVFSAFHYSLTFLYPLSMDLFLYILILCVHFE